MSYLVVSGASLACPFGTAPATLMATSQTTCIAGGKPAATIKDTAYPINISGFAMCTSMANPQVASATAAAFGVLTPQPCQPTAAAPWICLKKTLAAGTPCLGSEGTLLCTMGAGVISITSPGQFTILVE